MKTEPKTIVDAEKTVLDRRGEGSALKESERVMSTSERVFLNELRERGIESMHKNHLDVWVVSDSRGYKNYEFDSKFIEIENEHNEAVKQGGDETREYRFWLKDFGDLKYGLKETFGNFSRITEVPEMIIIKAEPGEHDSSWTGVPKMVQEAVDQCVERLYRYWDEGISSYLGENLCCPLSDKFDFSKVEINEDNLIEYGLVNLESVNWKQQGAFCEKYIFTKDEKYIRDFFSDDVLRDIYKFMCTFDEDGAYDLAGYFWGSTSFGGMELDEDSQFFNTFRGEVDHDEKRSKWQSRRDALKNGGIEIDDEEEYDREGEEVEKATENYLQYRKDIAEASVALGFENIKEKMREHYVARIKKYLDEFSPQYAREYDMLEAERKLLRPILVLVSENPVQRELMRDEGVEIVLDNIASEDVKGLLELLGRVKSSSASLMPEKLRRIKSDFYKSVEDKLDERSEITAETEKEVEILQEIFQQTGNVKKVLDVACGNGRIDIPLLERGYEVTGVDANEQFLQSALKKALEKELQNAKFKKGDVIDYRGAVEPGSQDAVIYTWHSILEAFGPGNTLHTLGNAWQALRPGGVLVFDQPTRQNPHMENGWYENNPDSQHRYLSYIMSKDEIEFILKMAGFENVEIREWETKLSEEYPDGMRKFTVSARKPDMSEDAKSATRMYRGMIQQDRIKKMQTS